MAQDKATGKGQTTNNNVISTVTDTEMLQTIK